MQSYSLEFFLYVACAMEDGLRGMRYAILHLPTYCNLTLTHVTFLTSNSSTKFRFEKCARPNYRVIAQVICSTSHATRPISWPLLRPLSAAFRSSLEDVAQM